MEERELTIMVIDDDHADTAVLKHYLQRIPNWKLTLLCFTNSAQAISQGLEKHSVDLILLDYLLGRETGLDVISRLHEAGWGLPIVVLSGHGSEEVAVSMMREGAYDYLSKNALSEIELKRTITGALERHCQEKQLDQQQKQLKKTNHDLQNRNQEIREFKHSVAREISSPLTATLESLNRLLVGVAGPMPKDQRHLVDLARDSCRVIHRQVMDLLESDGPENGKFTFSPHPSSILMVVEQVLKLMNHQAQERNISLEHEIPASLPKVSMDVSGIKQVLTSLVVNALKNSPAGGQVLITANYDRYNSGMLRICVNGTCPGLDPASGETDTRESDGHDLDLDLHRCKEIITAHHGEIEITRVPGKESPTSFTLPMALRGVVALPTISP